MEEIILNTSDFSNEEVIELLLKALTSSNAKRCEYTKRIASLQEELSNNELNNEKLHVEKDIIISSLKSQIDEKIKIVSRLESNVLELNSRLDNTKSNLEDTNRKLNEEIAKSEQTANILVEANKKLALNQKTIEQNLIDLSTKDSKLSEISSQFTSFRIDLLKYLISGEISNIKAYLNTGDESIPTGIVSYFQSLAIASDVLNKTYDNEGELCQELLKSEGLLSKVATLLWWINADVTKTILVAHIRNLSNIAQSLSVILRTISFFGINIDIPHTNFGENISNYVLYDNSKSCIKKVFPDIEIASPSLCEIYKVAYNNTSGQCFYV